MRKTIRFIVRYPLEITVGLILLPFLFDYPALISGGLFFLPCLLLAWLFFKKSPRYRYPLSSGVFLLAVLGLYLDLKIPWFWPLSLGFSAASIKLIAIIRKKFDLEPRERKNFRLFALITVFNLALIPTLTATVEKSLEVKTRIELNSIAKDKAALLSGKDEEALKATEALSHDETILNLLQTNNLKELLPVAQAKMLMNNLSFLTVTDELGYVKAAAHQPQSAGYNILENSPELKPVFEGQNYKGLKKEGNLPPFVYAGTAIVKDKKTIGAIFCGYRLNDNTIKNIAGSESLALYQDGKLNSFYSENPDISALMSHSETAARIAQEKNNTLITFKQNGRYFFGAAATLAGTDGKVLVAKEENHNRAAAYWVAAIMAIVQIPALKLGRRYED